MSRSCSILSMEADAIRQTIKVAMFATGLIAVCVLMIILGCTNLPKEIDNRVIYTIVTKPTTRLEIVLGKIIGFARVSATILFIMGLSHLGVSGRCGNETCFRMCRGALWIAAMSPPLTAGRLSTMLKRGCFLREGICPA